MEKISPPAYDDPAESSCASQPETAADFFNLIAHRQVDVVTDIITKGLVSADTTNEHGETPLIAAVRANDAAMVRMLVSLGAAVDGYGLYLQQGHMARIERTPLQVAATEGKLGMVRILRELGADDSLIAPDGAMALRLAAENGHREVVDFLPTRRGGAWKRWTVTHEKQMQRVRRILEKFGSILKIIGWAVPRYFLWTLPKGIFVTLPKEIWERRHKIGPWCKRQIHKFPKRMKKAAKLASRGVEKTTEVIKKTPGKVWQVMKRIPGALWIIISWVGKGLGKLGYALFRVIKRLASLIHTAIGAVVSFFRAITLQDIANGLRAVLQAIFIDFPKTMVLFIKAFSKTSYKVLETVLGSLGMAIWYLIAMILYLIWWVPKKIWQMVQACGISMGKGVEEILVWINPKRM